MLSRIYPVRPAWESGHIYLLFAGHNLPGGGFAGGLVAGMALVMRYVAGGRYELGAAAPTDAGRLLGVGMTIGLKLLTITQAARVTIV